MWRVGLCFCLVIAAGCGRRPLSPFEPVDAGRASIAPVEHDGGSSAPDAGGEGGTLLGRPSAADAGTADTGSGDAGDASEPMCPPLGAPDAGADVAAGNWGAPTAVPFSCAPMPGAFFFPRPGADVVDAYARCASFADQRASSLAVNGDGSRVALIGVDGIARVVDVPSRTVVGVLAPPRATVGLAAFSPSGDTILTVARGERLVTLWRADTFAPIWTTRLPGHTYQDEYQGAAAFSPDGTVALVSPGWPLYLLDSSTGAIRATNSDLGGVVLNAGYGWGGRRIAALAAPIAGMCARGAFGGTVTILEPTTLLPLATPMTWPLLGDEAPPPGQLLVAANADLIVTSAPATGQDETPKAFRLSDGGALAPPALPSASIAPFPLALSPDGSAVLTTGTGTLELVRLSDGASIASTTAVAPTAAAFSGDGSTVAAGSSGDALLGIWRPAAGPLVATCTADARAHALSDVQTSLSADGATIAVDWGDQIRLLRRADGTTVSTVDRPGNFTVSLQLSPDAQYVVGQFDSLSLAPTSFAQSIFRSADGAGVADLPWFYPRFLSDGRRLDGVVESSAKGGAVMQIDLETGVVSTKVSVDRYMYLVGLSADCPLLLDPNNMELFRACRSCRPLPVASNSMEGVVSLDGSRYLSDDGDAQVRGTVLWNIASQPGVLRTYSPRPEEATWQASEIPVAVSRHGARVITGAEEHASCPWAPGFTSRVHDVATDTVVDELPPHVTSTSADLGVIAFGPVLWCAR